MGDSPEALQARFKHSPLALTPASRSTDTEGGSFDAEDLINKTDIRATQQRDILAAFCRHPGATTKEISELEHLDRHMVAKRAPELYPVYLDRIGGKGMPKGQREFRWHPTIRGRQVNAGRKQP